MYYKKKLFLLLCVIVALSVSNVIAQSNFDVVTLKNGKVFQGKIKRDSDSLNLQIVTEDEMSIIIKKENIESVRYAIIDTAGLKKAHYFNFPAGTKFITEIKSNNLVFKQEVEIVDIKNDEMKLKTIIYQYGGTQQSTSWSKARFQANKVSYYLGIPELTFKEGSDEWVSYPINPEVEMVLPDVILKGKIYSEGFKVPFTSSYVDQKVISKEIITTPAGTFDCYLLSYSTQSNMLLINMKSKVKCWISDRVGIVKTEAFNKTGELQSESVLESIH